MIADERKENRIRCKMCGKWFIFLGCHVSKYHGVLMRDYKEKYGYNVAVGLIPEWYRKKLSKMVTDESKAQLTGPGGDIHKDVRQKWSPEQREKHIGFKHSKESRQKISKTSIEVRYTEPPEYDVDVLTCRICGNKVIQLGAHVRLQHKMSPREYKKQFNLPLYTGLIPNWKRRLKHEGPKGLRTDPETEASRAEA